MQSQDTKENEHRALLLSLDLGQFLRSIMMICSFPANISLAIFIVSVSVVLKGEKSVFQPTGVRK